MTAVRDGRFDVVIDDVMGLRMKSADGGTSGVRNKFGVCRELLLAVTINFLWTNPTKQGCSALSCSDPCAPCFMTLSPLGDHSFLQDVHVL